MIARASACAMAAVLLGLAAAVSTVEAHGTDNHRLTAADSADERDVRNWSAQLVGSAGGVRLDSFGGETLATVGAERQAALLRIARRNPRRALDLAISAADRRLIPEPARSAVEQPVTASGVLRIAHEDFSDGHAEYRADLAHDGQFTRAYLAGPSSARSGDNVRLSGISIGSGGPLVVEDVTVESASAISSVGPQRTAILLVSTSDAPPHPDADANAVASVVFSAANPQSLRSFYSLASYGQTTVVGASGDGTARDVYGPYVMALSSSDPLACDFDGQTNAALGAVGASLPFNQYDRVVIDWNAGANGCGPSWGYVGQGYFSTPFGQQIFSLALIHSLTDQGALAFNGKVGSTFLHEYGHNLGLYHAAAYNCGPGLQVDSNCGGIEYGDPADVMGSSMDGQPSSVQKDILGWLGGRQQVAAASGYYTISALEDPGAGIKGLKVPRTRDGSGNVTGYFYLEYRHPPTAWQAWLQSLDPAGQANYSTGVEVHATAGDGICIGSICNPDFYFQYGDDSVLLPTKPVGLGAWSDVMQAPLTPGQWYYDRGAGVSLLVTNSTASDATVLVWIGSPSPTIRTMVNPPEAGTVSGTGIFSYGQTVTLIATPHAGYRFIGWFETRQTRGYPNPYTFAATGDRVLEAEFQLLAPPPNDSWAAATPISGLPAQITQSMWRSTLETGEPVRCSNSNFTASVWFRYTPAATGPVNLNVTSEIGYPLLAIYTGNAVNSLTAVPGTSCGRQATFVAQAGVAYSIQVGALGYAPALFTLTASPGPGLATSILTMSSVPSSWWTGQTQSVNLQISNGGPTTLANVGPNAVHVAVSFGLDSDSPGVGWVSSQTFALPAPIPPASPSGGNAVFLAVPITAPVQTGSYILRFSTYQDGVGWSQSIVKMPVTVLVNCAIRPAVNMSVAPGSGRLSVSVSAGGGGALRSISLGVPSPVLNALADIGSQLGQSSGTIYLPAGTRQMSFTIRRVQPGAASTLAFTVNDDCGNWPTFAGGGPNAF